jgi:curved DNA-binding protein CbpA
MTSDSKIFVGLKPTKKTKAASSKPLGPKCQWDGCENEGVHRAPVGRDGEGLYLLFCPKHTKEYNSGYNFAVELSDPVVARYQKEAATGRRRTYGTAVNRPSEAPLPSSERSGSAKTINARKDAEQRQREKVQFQQRKLKVLEAKAFETLGLSEDATPEEIRVRYKQKLKMHHPDANQGNRNSEDDLRAAIDAHKILKLNGFC